jgi:hypothetical protein
MGKSSELKPLLSILVPAYCYGEGLVRILTHLRLLPMADCEIIVFDDSPDDGIEAIVSSWCTATGMQVTYQHNCPALGVPANWNALLNKARGKYCLLLHHDEFPLGDNFVTDLVQVLRENPDVDAIMLDCILVNPCNWRCRRHLPTWLRAFVVSRFPQYLFRRNVIGPTSALVIRRTLYPRFDERLRWLIDVDVYVRLLKVTRCLKLCPQIQVGSILGRTDSITAGLGASIPQIAREERTYLKGVHHTAGLWLGPARGEPILHSMMRACEAVCWDLMRGLTRIMAAFSVDPVPRSVVEQAMKTPPGP